MARNCDLPMVAAMNRADRIDQAEEAAQEAYDKTFTRIAERMKAENIADGADEDYRPSGATVHRLVLEEFKRKKADHG